MWGCQQLIGVEHLVLKELLSLFRFVFRNITFSRTQKYIRFPAELRERETFLTLNESISL